MLGQFVSQGLGSPADISVWLLAGLSPTGPVAVEPADGEIVHVLAHDRTVAVEAQTRTVAIDAVDRTILIETRPTP